MTMGQSERDKKYDDKCRQEGRCLSCTAPAKKGNLLCENHLKKYNEAQKKRIIMRKYHTQVNMKKAILLIIVLLLVPLVYAQDVTNRIAGNSTLIVFPQNLSLANNSRTLIGVDLIGTVNGSNVTFVTSDFKTNGTALNFTGASKIIFDSPDSKTYHNVTHENWTTSGWFKLSTQSSGAHMFWGQADTVGTSENHEYASGINKANNRLFCTISGALDNNAQAFSSATAVENLEWHHLICVYNKTGSSEWTVTQWLDGNMTNWTILSVSIATPRYAFTIGASSREGEIFQPTIGLIDEVTLINYSLTGNEVKHLYNLTSNGTKVYFNEPSVSDTTPPVINITNKNTSVRINDVLNITAYITGTATSANITFNLTGNWDKYNFSFALTGATQVISQNITINLTRGNVINASVTACDSLNNCDINSTLITVANTIPNGTNFVNVTGKHYNKNITRLNWTPATNPDGDTLRYVVYWDLDITPTSLYYNGSDLNISTNWTSDNAYFYQIKVMDEISESALSPVFNLTLDTGLPTLTINCTNNTFTRFNLTCKFSIEDPFPYNLSVEVVRGSSSYFLRTNQTTVERFINITFLLNLTEDGNYTIYINASDNDKTSPPIDSKLTKQKLAEETHIYTDSEKSIRMDLNIEFENATGNALPLPLNLKTFSEFNNKGTHLEFGLNFTTDKQGTKPIFNVKTINVSLFYLNSTGFNNFVWKPYGIDFEVELKVNNQKKDYGVQVKKVGQQNNYQVILMPNETLNVGANVTITSTSVFGLNVIDISNILVNDKTAPTFIDAFNRSITTNSTNITTATSVNITIFGLDDLYLDRGNFSHNASGSWANVSIAIAGNATPYHYVIGSGNFTANQVVGWKFYVYDIAGNLLDPIYTFTVGSVASPSPSGGGGGGDDDETTIVTSGTGGVSGSASGEVTIIVKSPIEAFVPQIWLTEQSTPINLLLYKNNTLYDPVKIEFEFNPDKNNIIYENLTRNSIGNYTASFYVLSSAEEGKYGLIIKVTSSPTETLEIPFEIKKSNPIIEFAKERVQDVQKIIEKVTGSNKEKLSGWQIGLIIGGTVFAILMLIMFGLLLSKIGGKEKPKVKTGEYY